MTRRRPEEALQAQIVDGLRLSIPTDAVLMSVPNERWGANRAELGRMIRIGMLPGAPDLLIIWRGRVIALEIKAPKGSPSKAQRAAHPLFAAAGAPVKVCRSLEDALAALEAVRIPLRRVIDGGDLRFPKRVDPAAPSIAAGSGRA